MVALTVFIINCLFVISAVRIVNNKSQQLLQRPLKFKSIIIYPECILLINKYIPGYFVDSINY